MATPAWQRKEGQNPEGGLNATGRPYPNLVDNAAASRKLKK